MSNYFENILNPTPQPETQTSVQKTVCFYAHKGGVGKTSLLLNTLDLCIKQGKKTILIDFDPQMNSTYFCMHRNNRLLLNDDSGLKMPFSVYYDSLIHHFLLDAKSPDKRTDLENLQVQKYNLGRTNAYDILSNDFHDDNNIGLAIEGPFGKFDMICSHPMLMEYERFMGPELVGNIGKGFDYCKKIRKLLLNLSSRYDCILLDLSPSSSYLNQVLLINCQYIVLPCTADEYAHYAIKTMGFWLQTWINRYPILKGNPQIMTIIYNKYKIHRDLDVICMNNMNYFTTNAHKSFINKLKDAIKELKEINELKNITSILDENNFPMIRDCLSTIANLQIESKTFMDEVSSKTNESCTTIKARNEFLVFWNIFCFSMNWTDSVIPIESNLRQTSDIDLSKVIKKSTVWWELNGNKMDMN